MITPEEVIQYYKNLKQKVERIEFFRFLVGALSEYYFVAEALDVRKLYFSDEAVYFSVKSLALVGIMTVEKAAAVRKEQGRALTPIFFVALPKILSAGIL